MTDAAAIAARLRDAFASRQVVAPLSSQDSAFDLTAAYAVERELARMRRESGRRTVGRKVGYANRAVWRVMKLSTLVWASMYDDTVHFASGGRATLSTARMIAPKIEPEIVFKLKRPLAGGDSDAAAVLDATEWIALGFEIVQCPFPDWRFSAADAIAAFAIHGALVVGERVPVAGIDDCAAKLRACLPFAARPLDPARIETAIGLIARLETLDDVAELVPYCV
jgi:2-oxo-3-hexenedioate decarboxylase